MERPLSPRRSIAIVCRNYGRIGGTELFAKELAQGTARTGEFDVHVIAARRGQTLPEPDGVKLHLLPPLNWLPTSVSKILFAALARRVLRREKIDLIHSFDLVPGAQLVTAGAPHSFWVHRVRRKPYAGLKDLAAMYLERRTFEHPDCRRLLAVSPGVSNLIIESFPALAQKVSVLEPGVHFSRFNIAERAALRLKLRQRAGIGESEVAALFVGNNFELKGLRALLESVRQAKRSGTTMKLLVVGRDRTTKFQALAESLGLQEEVRFVGLVKDRIERYFYAADFLVLPSKFETFGMVVLEAMAAALPVVVSRSCGVSYLVAQSGCGIVLEQCDDVAALTQALVVMSAVEARQRFAEASQHAAQERDWRQVCARVQGVYRAMLDDGQRG